MSNSVTRKVATVEDSGERIRELTKYRVVNVENSQQRPTEGDTGKPR